MRLHIVSLPQTQTTKAYDFCAYTAKVRRLGDMLHAKGHEMILYSGDENEATCSEHVPITDINRWFGGPWPLDTVFDRWDVNDLCWREMNAAAIREIDKRIEPGDGVGIIAGLCQQSIADHFAAKGHPIIEWGIGYEGILSNSYHAFESEAWRHFVHGQQSMRYPDGGWGDGRFFDVVIPNAFNASDFRFTTKPDDYLLFLGRHTARKGLAIVYELAKEHRVITAGQGSERVEGAEYVGLVLGDEKAQLLANAKAVLVPTIYIEPFGGVAVEAMMSGAPVITTNYGVFTETVNQGLSGFRCDTLAEFKVAANKIDTLDRTRVREWGMRYSTKSVAPKYDAWLKRLATLQGAGWYA